MTLHAKLSPSSAARRVKCPGSRALEARFKSDKPTPHTLEGEAAHHIAALMLQDPHQCMPEIAPNGELVTDEMIDGAKLYYDTVKAAVVEHLGVYDASQVVIEQTIDISYIHPDCFGTPDAYFFKAPNHLYIFDYKFGHKYVDVFENFQLLEYCAGILQKLNVNGLQDQHIKVHFVIVQPRCYHRDGQVRAWVTTAAALRGLFNILIDAESQASQETAPCRVSEECDFCAASHVCTTLQQAAASATDVSLLNAPLVLNATQTGHELKRLKRAQALLEARILGLELEATAKIRSGAPVTNWKLEAADGRETWKVPKEEIITLGELLGIDLRKIDVITPRQAVKAGVDESLVKNYTERLKGQIKLVAEDSSKARKIFGGAV